MDERAETFPHRHMGLLGSGVLPALLPSMGEQAPSAETSSFPQPRTRRRGGEHGLFGLLPDGNSVGLWLGDPLLSANV